MSNAEWLTSKEKRYRKISTSKSLNMKYDFLQRDKVDALVRERFHRKPYGKVGEEFRHKT